MAIPVLILGQSGTGKSYSMKNFDENEVCLISVQKSLLPFRKKFNETVVTDKYAEIAKAMKATKKSVIVIDDTQYLMANEFMRRATERGYDKFTEIAFNFWDLIVQEVNSLPAETIVYLLCHTATDENGIEKMKTIGKLVDEKITPEGLFTIVLKTAVSDGNYAFVTQNNGKDTVKSPEGMFDTYAINNDLKYVDEKIRNYYELGDHFLTDEEMAEIDRINKKAGIEPPKGREERKRRERNADSVKPKTAESGNNEAENEENEPVKTTGERKRRKASDIAETVEEAKVLEVFYDPNEDGEEQKPLRQRKSREQVEADNKAKMTEYMEAQNKAIEEIADGREEIPFEEVPEIPVPELEPVPRRRRKRTE